MKALQDLLLIAVGSAFVNNVCTEPVSRYLSVPWRIQKCKDSRRYGKCRCIRYHDCFIRYRSDL